MTDLIFWICALFHNDPWKCVDVPAAPTTVNMMPASGPIGNECGPQCQAAQEAWSRLPDSAHAVPPDVNSR